MKQNNKSRNSSFMNFHSFWAFFVVFISAAIMLVISFDKDKWILSLLISICCGCLAGGVYYFVSIIQNERLIERKEEYYILKTATAIVNRVLNMVSVFKADSLCREEKFNFQRAELCVLLDELKMRVNSIPLKTQKQQNLDAIDWATFEKHKSFLEKENDSAAFVECIRKVYQQLQPVACNLQELVLEMEWQSCDTDLSATKRTKCAKWGIEEVDNQATLFPGASALIVSVDECNSSYVLKTIAYNAADKKKVLYIDLVNSFEQSTVNVQTILSTTNQSNADVELYLYNHAIAGGSFHSIAQAIKSTECDLVVINGLDCSEDFSNGKYMMAAVKNLAVDIQCPIISVIYVSQCEDIHESDAYTYSDIVQILRNCGSQSMKKNEVEIVKNDVGRVGVVSLD